MAKGLINLSLMGIFFGGHLLGEGTENGGTPACVPQRPFMQTDAKQKERLLKLIETHDWAAKSFNEMKEKVRPMVEAHTQSPAKSLEAVPPFPAGIHSHGNAISRAYDAAVLYFMTGNEEYAQYAADVLNVYVQAFGVEGLEPSVSKDGFGRDLLEVHSKIALVYDFIYPFLVKNETTVFDKASQTRIPFDISKAQILFRNVLKFGFDFWIEGSNHTEMEGKGLLYCALAIDDKAERDAAMETFLKGPRPLSGLNWMRQFMIDNDGFWPESAHYSGAYGGVLSMLEVVDRVYPEKKLLSGFQNGLNGGVARLFYSYPNDTEAVCFGDSNRRIPRDQLPGFFVPLIRRGICGEEMAQRILGQMKAEREVSGVTAGSILWMDPLEDCEAKRIETQSVVIPYASVIIQNNLNGTDRKENGMMYYSGGAEYVHSHLTGIDLELYGAGYVMGGVGGNYGPRGADVFRYYYRNYAGHNTVVVNETSRGGTKGFWGSQSILYMDRTGMEAMEPAPYTPAVSKDFTFSSQRLDDTVNNATQQRIVGIIRTSSTTGYYLDLFRSRSNEKNKCHDYIYHNMGERLVLQKAGGVDLPLTAAPNRYQSYSVTEKVLVCDLGGKSDAASDDENRVSKNWRWGEHSMLFPGWHFFSEVMTSAPAAESIHGTFYMEALNRFMHVAMPGGFDREYTSAKAPPISGAAKPYSSTGSANKKETSQAQVLSIRQRGEAWDRPFVVVYEASASKEPTVQSIENILDAGRVVGAKVVSKVDGRVITDLILAQDKANATYENKEAGIRFTGRYAIIRTIQSGSASELVLYIGDGEKVSFQGHELSVGKARKGCKSLQISRRK